MSLFEHVPYTNFHDLNLSWILKFTNRVKGKLDEIDASVAAALAAQAGAEDAEAGAVDAKDAAEAAAAQAAGSATQAGQSATNAANSAIQAQQSATAAQTAAQQAAGSANTAQQAAQQAGTSGTSAQQAAQQAAQSATNAAGSATQAAGSAANAANSATAAGTSATNAANSATAAQQAAASVPSEAVILEKAFKQVLPLCFWTGGGVATVRDRATKPNINNLYEEYSGMVEMIMPADDYWQDAYEDYAVGGDYGTFRVWHPCSGGLAIPILLQQGQNTDRFIIYPSALVGDYVDSDGDMHVFGRVWDIVNNNWAANGTVVGPLSWLILPTTNYNFGSNV